MESVREVATPAPIDLTLYLPAVTPARRTFLRRDLRFPDEPAVSYARRLEPHRQREGVFVDLEAADLSSYIAKPVSFRDWVDLIRTLSKYWFECVTLPSDS